MNDYSDYTEDDVHEAARKIPRVVEQLKKLGSEHESPVGWEARVLSATAPQRSRHDYHLWIFVLVCALVCGGIIGYALYKT